MPSHLTKSQRAAKKAEKAADMKEQYWKAKADNKQSQKNLWQYMFVGEVPIES